MSNYYEILEVTPTSTREEIKKSFRKLALKWHPDKNAGKKEANEKFAIIGKAYKTLSDEEEKLCYDLHHKFKKPQKSSSSKGKTMREERATPVPANSKFPKSKSEATTRISIEYSESAQEFDFNPSLGGIKVVQEGSGTVQIFQDSENSIKIKITSDPESIAIQRKQPGLYIFQLRNGNCDAKLLTGKINISQSSNGNVNLDSNGQMDITITQNYTGSVKISQNGNGNIKISQIERGNIVINQNIPNRITVNQEDEFSSVWFSFKYKKSTSLRFAKSGQGNIYFNNEKY